jgi:hypothetical protein
MGLICGESQFPCLGYGLPTLCVGSRTFVAAVGNTRERRVSFSEHTFNNWAIDDESEG